MDIFLEILGVVFLAVAYFVLQTYTSKKSRIPTKLNNPELVPIIEKEEADAIEKVSFEDLVGEMTDKESEDSDYDEFENHLDTDTAQLDEENFTSSGNNTEYLKLEKEVLRLKEIVENLDKEFHQKGEKEDPGKGSEGQHQCTKNADKDHIKYPGDTTFDGDAVIKTRVKIEVRGVIGRHGHLGAHCLKGKGKGREGRPGRGGTGRP